MLIDVKHLMSLPMFHDLHTFSAGLQKGVAVEISKVEIDKGGYSKSSGQYLGSPSKGERIHKLSCYLGAIHIRSSATASQILAALNVRNGFVSK